MNEDSLGIFHLHVTLKKKKVHFVQKKINKTKLYNRKQNRKTEVQ